MPVLYVLYVYITVSSVNINLILIPPYEHSIIILIFTDAEMISNDQAICPYLLATNKKTTSTPTEKYDQNTWIYISLQNKHIIPISMRIGVQHH